MSIYQNEAFAPVGARLGKVEVIPVTTSSVIHDLSARTNIWNDLKAGRLVLADADGADVYYGFNSENSGTVDETNTTPGNATQCGRVPAGALVPFRPFYHSIKSKNSSGGAVTTEGICQFLLVKASVACKLRLYVCSQAPSDGP